MNNKTIRIYPSSIYQHSLFCARCFSVARGRWVAGGEFLFSYLFARILYTYYHLLLYEEDFDGSFPGNGFDNSTPDLITEGDDPGKPDFDGNEDDIIPTLLVLSFGLEDNLGPCPDVVRGLSLGD